MWKFCLHSLIGLPPPFPPDKTSQRNWKIDVCFLLYILYFFFFIYLNKNIYVRLFVFYKYSQMKNRQSKLNETKSNKKMWWFFTKYQIIQYYWNVLNVHTVLVYVFVYVSMRLCFSWMGRGEDNNRAVTTTNKNQLLFCV